MPDSKVKFSYKYVERNFFGRLYRPYAKLLVKKKSPPKIWLERVLVVDTGADFTLFPKKDAFIFGIDLAKETVIDETFGIGGVEKVYFYKNLEVKLGKNELKIPVGFLDRSDIPALLGRQQFLDLFKTTFDNFVVSFEK